MDIKKVREMRMEALNQERVKKLAREIAQKSGLEVDEVVRFLRRFWYKLTVELETKGEADFLGVGKLIIDKENPKGGLEDDVLDIVLDTPFRWMYFLNVLPNTGMCLQNS